MAQKRHTAEQIISKLRQVEVAQAQGATIPQAVKQIQFIRGLKLAGVGLNRKVLADLAARNPEGFAQLAGIAKEAVQ